MIKSDKLKFILSVLILFFVATNVYANFHPWGANNHRRFNPYFQRLAPPPHFRPIYPDGHRIHPFYPIRPPIRPFPHPVRPIRPIHPFLPIHPSKPIPFAHAPHRPFGIMRPPGLRQSPMISSWGYHHHWRNRFGWIIFTPFIFWGYNYFYPPYYYAPYYPPYYPPYYYPYNPFNPYYGYYNNYYGNYPVYNNYNYYGYNNYPDNYSNNYTPGYYQDNAVSASVKKVSTKKTTQQSAQSNEKWANAANGNVPDYAVLNKQIDNTSTYYCRATYKNEMEYGYLIPKDGCYVEKELVTMRFLQYQVLVSQ